MKTLNEVKIEAFDTAHPMAAPASLNWAEGQLGRQEELVQIAMAMEWHESAKRSVQDESMKQYHGIVSEAQKDMESEAFERLKKLIRGVDKLPQGFEQDREYGRIGALAWFLDMDRCSHCINTYNVKECVDCKKNRGKCHICKGLRFVKRVDDKKDTVGLVKVSKTDIPLKCSKCGNVMAAEVWKVVGDTK